MKTSKFSLVLAALAVVMIAVGTLTGEAQLVLSKAINICMECIGIGLKTEKYPAVVSGGMVCGNQRICKGLPRRKDL